ncbi:hypothetical protein PhaeoP83_01693 [Phaeobacter inhibens]|uniref:Uncharacterized protein n=1 Tax=Phaeobacter inhibens TaxID=221822 RepID=A0ABM6RDQ8_9RHOB|nr:hypothetical protein [Phaeobacter inhibens]AUQ49967.1 hypothetical protein PhaeoP83_01693 [Phaeobacter inhibens]AUQ93833.1 hypothetical protein PhaeoP66_01029 [Phaeobacter inhibens]AUQ94523.1 hypothetical protein PhaeoP66_01741 [Phaeobacter inhibens]AUQ97369.1 hypothetical protein PhaeoP66_04643 [Phaeobacter inhibens]AUR19772.1 hypothetical protein PhaeoP80_01693 [Phaeobacter inhibens]
MIEKHTPQGQRYWEPEDRNDVALLKMAEGATFGETTFPSGWTSPAGTQVAKDGLLYESNQPRTTR